MKYQKKVFASRTASRTLIKKEKVLEIESNEVSEDIQSKDLESNEVLKSAAIQIIKVMDRNKNSNNIVLEFNVESKKVLL